MDTALGLPSRFNLYGCLALYIYRQYMCVLLCELPTPVTLRGLPSPLIFMGFPAL